MAEAEEDMDDPMDESALERLEEAGWVMTDAISLLSVCSTFSQAEINGHSILYEQTV